MCTLNSVLNKSKLFGGQIQKLTNFVKHDNESAVNYDNVLIFRVISKAFEMSWSLYFTLTHFNKYSR